MYFTKAQSLKTRFLFITLLFFLVFVGIAGSWLYFEVQGMIRDLGERYAVERVESAQLQLARVIEREAALARSLAGSPVIIEWMLDEDDPDGRERAFAEIASYRESFSDSNSFIGILASRQYYTWNADGSLTTSRMNREEDADQWFFRTVKVGKPVNFDLDYDAGTGVRRVSINCPVEHDGKRLGLAGTSLDITDTVSRLVASGEAGTNVMLVSPRGEILAHQDSEITAQNAGAGEDEETTSIYDLLQGEEQRKKIDRLIAGMRSGGSTVVRLALEGETGLTAMTPSSNLNAYVLASVDTSEYLTIRDFFPMFLLLAVTIILGLTVTTVFLQRIVLRPLAGLTDSAERIAEGEYDLSIPVKGSSEIAVLSSAFNHMTEKIRDYTQNLEQMVDDRTSRLREANDQLTRTNNRMMESIRYASLIQGGIMPGEKTLAELFPYYSLFFRQRDIVGGDMLYLHRLRPEDPGAGFFAAVIDCEGHGVSGALMTMMTESVLEHVVPAYDPHDPASILMEVEQEIQGALSAGDGQDTLQSGFDIGLCACFPREEKLVFAGAGMPLYVRDGNGEIETVHGRRKAIRNRHRLPPKAIENVGLSSADRFFFLITDGFVDQSGGEEGRSYGTRRLHGLLSEFPETGKGFEAEFDGYRGEHAQRDDVLAIAFSLSRPESA